MSGAKSRRRGLAWERRVARDLSELYQIDAERILEEPREGLVGDVRVNLPLSIQAKCGKRPRIYDALDEAQEAADAGEYAVAAVKRSRGRGKEANRMAVLPWDQFLEIVATLRRERVW